MAVEILAEEVIRLRNAEAMLARDSEKHRADMVDAEELSKMQHAQAFGAGVDHGAAQWQPIETAPKDGTSILLLRDDEAVAGFWANESYDDIYHWVFLNQTNPNVKFGIDGMVELNAFNAMRGPTHWKPITE